MKKIHMKIISINLLIIILLSLFINYSYADNKNNKTVTPVEAHGKLHVDGRYIKDENENIFQIRGVSSHGIGLSSYYHKFINQESLNFMRDEWGINAVRLTRYTPNNDATYLDYLDKTELIKERIEYAINSGLYVIIDWHVLKPGDPNLHKAEAIDFFKTFANLYKDYPNIIYEIANEPNENNNPEGTIVDWEHSIKPYSEEVISEIRKIDNDAIIIVGTQGYSHGIDVATENPIIGYDNLVYSYHFYAATNKEKYRKRLTNAIDAGLPVFISECGMVSANGDGVVDYESASEWIKILDNYNVGYMVWQLTNKAEGSSLIKNEVAKLTNWTYDELTDHGKWLVDNFKKYPNDNILVDKNYKFIEDDEQIYILGINKEMTFRINANYNLFKNGGKVYLDDEIVDSKNYTSKSGSTIITFDKDYINSLSEGKHNLKVLFKNNGIAKTNFTISKEYNNTKQIVNNEKNPPTGDNINNFVKIFLLSIISIYITIKIKTSD